MKQQILLIAVQIYPACPMTLLFTKKDTEMFIYRHPFFFFSISIVHKFHVQVKASACRTNGCLIIVNLSHHSMCLIIVKKKLEYFIECTDRI